MPAPIYCYGDTPPPFDPTGRSVEENFAANWQPPPPSMPPMTDLTGHCRISGGHWQLETAPIPKQQSYEAFVAEQKYRADPANEAVCNADSNKRMTTPSDWNAARGVGDWRESQVKPWP